MTFTEMVAFLQGLGYGSGDATVQGLFINGEYRRICRLRAWSWLRASAVATMVPGVIEYTWSDFAISANPPRRLESARLLDTTVNPVDVMPLTWINPSEFNDARGSSATSWGAAERDVPEFWTRPSSAGLAVWLPPNLAYTLHLNYFAPAAVLSGAAEPAMPRDYHDVIPIGAAYTMALRQRDTVAIGELRGERDEILSQMAAEENSPQLQTYEKVSNQGIWQGMERR